MYYNAEPHRYNGPRESRKLNIIDGELRYLEIETSSSIDSLLLSIENNKQYLSLGIMYEEAETLINFSDAFSDAFS